MINENQVREKSSRLLNILKTCSSLIIAVCLGLYGIFFYLNYLGRNQLAVAQGEIAGLQKVNGGMKTEGSLRQAIKYKEDLIREVELEKTEYSHILKELNSLLPDGVGIIKLEVKSTGVNQVEVNIQGEAPSHLAVAQFGQILEEAEPFKDAVILVNRQDQGRNRISFAVKINPIKGSGQR
ncbi:MAG: PilN domain-containing protein [Thermincolia bacterium]